MKPKLLPLILLVTLLSFFAEASIVAGQITFVQAPPRTPQGQPQSQQQGQQGLPPEKKKSLSKYGPEDVFPGAREQEDNAPQPTRKNSRQSAGATASRSVTKPSPTPPANAAATPIPLAVSPTPLPLLAAATPAVVPVTSNRLTQSPAKNSAPSPLGPIALAAASLLVLGALIYVLGILRKKLREGR
jgi:hypothetical protein